jgi:hypothetical protein
MLHLGISDVIWYKMLFPDTGLSTRKQNTGEVVLQILSSLCLTSHYDATNTDRKQSGLPSGK